MYQEEYKRKLKSMEEIASQIQSGFVCATGTTLSMPVGLTEAIAKHILKNDLHGVTHHQILGIQPTSILSPELKGRYTFVSWFSGAPARKGVQAGLADVMPNYYRDIPGMWREFFRPDVFYATVSPMDKHGWFSFGCTGAEVMAQYENARYIFLEVNPNMPRTFGSQHIHISKVDALCENNVPMAELPPVEIDEVSQTIGNLITEEIPDGGVIQLGVGAVPNAVGNALMSKKNLGIHTELFTDSMVDLVESGAVTNYSKQIHKGKSVCVFAMGSKKLYDFVDDNPGVEFHSVDYINDPAVICQNDRAISINSALEVDFYGQVCAESIGSKHFSGTGGQVDYVRGSTQSKGGKSFIAFPSTAKNDSISKIKPALTPGAIVSTSKNDVDRVVTEYGIAMLRGKTLSQRTKELIRIAHPKFRDELLFEAKKMNIII
ncbi:MAG: acetyl-CoA hydrolase/transferase C-terminal domain-containing protein [Oscillospiraceae bacterium]|nr:acetyl-CoA hydrolase/transferase C-terminal domain-containing protein [Oscillospiraceae bacterium]